MLVFLRIENWLQIPVLLLIGFFEIAALPVLMALVQDGFVEDRAFINGLFLSINFVGTSLAIPWWVGWQICMTFRQLSNLQVGSCP